jgi:hypothetical protein
MLTRKSHAHSLTFSERPFDVQTLLVIRSSCVPEDAEQVEFCASRNWIYYMCIHKGVQLKSKLQHSGASSAAAWPPRRCVVAQQYSSATFISLRFHSRKEKFGRLYKNVIFFSIFIFKFACLKLRYLKFCKPEVSVASICIPFVRNVYRVMWVTCTSI